MIQELLCLLLGHDLVPITSTSQLCRKCYRPS